MVKFQPSKLAMRVRFPLPALFFFPSARAFALARFGFSIQRESLSASFRSMTRIASYDAAILPLPAGTLTQLEMFQNPIKIILGRTLGHTPLGIFAGFQVLDSDLFFGFLFLVLHLCYLSFAGLFMVCLFVLHCKNKQFSSRLE
jgi:hypothetical protein